MGPNNPIFAQRGDTGNLLATDPRHFRYDPTGPGFDIEPDNDMFLPPG